MNGFFSLLKKTIHPLLGYAFVAGFGAIAVATTVAATDPVPTGTNTVVKANCEQCVQFNNECVAKAGDNMDARKQCEIQTQHCHNQCASEGTMQQPSMYENGQTPNPMGTVPVIDTRPCVDQCLKFKSECAAKAADNADMVGQCGQSVQECLMRCQQMGTNADGRKPGEDQDGNRFGQPPGGMGQNPGQHEMQPQHQERPQMSQKDFERMKKQMLTFGSMVKRTKTRIAVLEKKGITAPAELKNAIITAEEILGKIKAAQSFEELEELDIPATMQDVGDIFREQVPNLERLANLSTIYKRIDRELARFNKFLLADKKLAPRSKVDLADAIAEFEKTLSSAKEAYANAKTSIAAGDLEDAFATLEQLFDVMAELGSQHEIIGRLYRLSTSVSAIGREITQLQRQVDVLKRAKKDVSSAQELVTQAKAKYEELKVAAKAKPINADTVLEILSDLTEARDQAYEEIQELKGIVDEMDIDSGIKQPTVTVPDFNNLFGMPADSGMGM